MTRLWTATVICTRRPDGKTDNLVDINVADDADITEIALLPRVLRMVADQAEQQMVDGTIDIQERTET